AISQVILEDSVQTIKNLDVFSIPIDESTNRGNKNPLIIYSQCVCESGLNNFLLSYKLISEGPANAKNIVVSELKAKGLDITNIVGIGTDGASVMTGKTGGVVKLLQGHSPSLNGVHCAAHRTALATSQAAKLVLHMEEYARTIASTFRYFNNSVLWSNRLRAIQSLLDMPVLKFAKVHSVRWLSLDHAVQVVYRTCPALCMTFQKETLDFSSVKPVVMSTCQCLKDLIEVNGVFVDKLSKFVKVEGNKVTYTRPLSKSDGKSVNDAIRNSVTFEAFSESESESEDEPDNQQKILSNITPDYINKLTNNLENRFSETEIRESMKVLIPENICATDSVAKYGVEELQRLATHFESHLPNKTEITTEYQMYKRLVKGSYSRSTILNVLNALMKSKDLPNMVMLLKNGSVIPMTSVGFSTQNRIKSKGRTSIKCLDDLMRISEDGPALRDFDFGLALAKWKAEKVRT
ncbi:ZN862-like protein, partial [Mya arenaria]